MSKFKTIASILLLGIYSVVVLHNIVPHFHCDSDSKIANSESSHIFHTGLHHSHNHDDHQEVNSGWFDSFLDLLGDLEHHELGEGHFENFTAQSQNFNFNFSIVDVIPSAIENCFIASVITITDKSSDYIDRPPTLYEQHRYCSSPLRGPPAIS